MNNGNIQHTDTNSSALFFETWLDMPQASQQSTNMPIVQPVTIRVSDFYDKELEEPYIAPLSRLAMFNEFCKNYYLGCGKGADSDVWLRNTNLDAQSAFRTHLREFITAFEQWITEMEDPKRPLKLFNVDDSNYSQLLVDKVMTRSKRLWRTEYAVSDDGIRSQLGKKFNDLDTNPAEKAKLVGRPCYLYLKWMTEIMKYYYDVIQNWT